MRKNPGSKSQIRLCRGNNIYLNPEASAGVSLKMIGGGKYNDAHSTGSIKKIQGMSEKLNIVQWCYSGECE